MSDTENYNNEAACSDEKNLADVREIMQIAKKNYPKAGVGKIMHAYEVADTMHSGQKRKSGEPFIVHPIAVAKMLAEMQAAVDVITAGMLHDVVEDTPMTIDDVQAEFGSTIASMVDGVTKLKKMSDATKEAQEAENLRKMVIAIADDPRVVVIKLVDRLHNMRTLQYMNTDKQQKKARETLEIYAPLAHRFGMSKIKWELEDLSFKYLDPISYNDLETQLNSNREEREQFITDIIEIVKKALEDGGISDAYIDGRPKHLYSIKRKMDTQNKTLDQIFDLLAIRVVVETEAQCYTVLGIIHHIFTPVEGRFKDYISQPKQNQYQSLHTTVMTRKEAKRGSTFEVQIRTWEMHYRAEMGIAAHWRYKEGSKSDATKEEEKRFGWVRTLYENQKEMETSDEFMEAFKMNLYTDEVFVYTPKGDVKALPKGSTPIDFAYSIHSDIGNRMVGARVNGELKPLDYVLQTSDKVEIITSNAPGRAPSRDWLKIVKSPEARTKLRQWFKKERREENIELGKVMLDRELKRQGHTYSELFDDEEIINEFLEKSNYHSLDDLLNNMGFGDITAQKVVSRLRDIIIKKNAGEQQSPVKTVKEDSKPKEKVSEDGIIVQDLYNCLVKTAKCCNPVPGDAIVGYTTRTRGVSVHRSDCPNIKAMEALEYARMIPVRWAKESSTVAKHPAELMIEAIDDGQTIIKVANIVSEMALKMTSFSSKNTKDDYLMINMVVVISDRGQLDKLIQKIERLDSVNKVTRSVK